MVVCASREDSKKTGEEVQNPAHQYIYTSLSYNPTILYIKKMSNNKSSNKKGMSREDSKKMEVLMRYLIA